MALWQELKNRRVVRALVAWGIASFGILQVIEPVMHALHWPDAVLTWAVALLGIGFPLIAAVAWVLDVQPVAPAPQRSRARNALILAAVALVAALPAAAWMLRRSRPAAAGSPSIAVLPLADMSPGKDQEYFGDGFAEELLDLLSKVPGLHVAGRTSSFAFKGRNDDLRAIAEKLNVATILEGSVRKSGDRIRVTTELISAQDGYRIWSETYDRQLTDLFAVQDEIASAVVAALRIRLLPQQTPSAPRAANPEAYNQYLLGRRFANLGDREGYRRAVEALQRSIELDPLYAPAWAALALARWHDGDYGETPVQIAAAQSKGLAAARKALELDPNAALAWVARGTLRVIAERDWEGAKSDFEHAAALQADNPEVLTAVAGWSELPRGKAREAAALLRKVTAIDPLNSDGWTLLGIALRDSGQLDGARAALTRALEIAPASDFAAMSLASVLLVQKKPAEALAASQRVGGPAARLFVVATAQHDLGHDAESAAALDEFVTKFGSGWAYQAAQIQAWLGNRDRAFAMLDRAWAQRDSGFFQLQGDVLLRSLHDDARYQALLEKTGLPR